MNTTRLSLPGTERNSGGATRCWIACTATASWFFFRRALAALIAMAMIPPVAFAFLDEVS